MAGLAAVGLVSSVLWMFFRDYTLMLIGSAAVLVASAVNLVAGVQKRRKARGERGPTPPARGDPEKNDAPDD